MIYPYRLQGSESMFCLLSLFNDHLLLNFSSQNRLYYYFGRNDW
jgi:hypothetical protein